MIYSNRQGIRSVTSLNLKSHLQKKREEPAYLEVLSIDVAGRTAVARVKDVYMGQTFIDSLSLVRDGASWKIYNKLYHMQ